MSLEEAVLRSVELRHLLFVIESIRATDQSGRKCGADPLCSADEEAFIAAMERELIADRSLSAEEIARLHALFGRAGTSSHPVLGDVRWLGQAVRLVDAVQASLKEFSSRAAG